MAPTTTQPASASGSHGESAAMPVLARNARAKTAMAAIETAGKTRYVPRSAQPEKKPARGPSAPPTKRVDRAGARELPREPGEAVGDEPDADGRERRRRGSPRARAGPRRPTPVIDIASVGAMTPIETTAVAELTELAAQATQAPDRRRSRRAPLAIVPRGRPYPPQPPRVQWRRAAVAVRVGPWRGSPDGARSSPGRPAGSGARPPCGSQPRGRAWRWSTSTSRPRDAAEALRDAGLALPRPT